MATKRPPSLLRSLRLIALAATLLGSGQFTASILFYKTALRAEGIILEFAANDALLEPETTPVVAFVDYRQQKWFASPTSALGSESLQRGQKRRILYDPMHPLNFRMDTPLGIWGAGIIRLLIGLVPFLGLSALIAATGKRAPMRQPRKASPPSKATEPTADTGVVRRMH